ncbi:unnamed protein product [Staurois parvus]|uniref:Uncharacterized protein n=1 Tax=Staurois parvus TaxID=386267 RepID=A0ABN9AUJ9_9NEOB|nr:unnamed protein product [Staurois parvus]
MLFDPNFSDPLLFSVSIAHLLIRHILWRHCTCLIWCVLLEVFFFFFFGRVHVISTGPISTSQTEVRGSTSFNQCSAEH